MLKKIKELIHIRNQAHNLRALSILESIFDSNDATTSAPSIDSEFVRKVQEAIPINLGTKKDPN